MITQINHAKQGVFSAHSTVGFFAAVCLAWGGMCVCHFLLCCPKPQVGVLLCAIVGCIWFFTTCGETFHLLIFPGVQGHNRLCKHILIHHQLHIGLQSFPIPLISLLTTINMNFSSDTRWGFLKKKEAWNPHSCYFSLSFLSNAVLIENMLSKCSHRRFVLP